MNSSNKVIGIIGIGGKVGKQLYSLLKNKYKVLGGQRSPSTNYPCEYLDIYNAESLDNFVKQCDVVVNCAGPSYLIKHCVAIAAFKRNTKYIDLFGGDYLIRQLKASSIDGVGIIGAGCFPGCSGIIPKYIAGKFDDIEVIRVISGGREQPTTSACIDIVMSTIAQFGWANTYYCDGEIKEIAQVSSDFLYIPGLHEEVILNEYLNVETMKVAKDLNVKEMHWYNISLSEEYNIALAKACAAWKINSKDKYQVVKNLIKRIELENYNKKLWYSLIIEVEGLLHGEYMTERTILKCQDSSLICAITAALSIKALESSDNKSDIMWASDIIQPENYMKEILGKEEFILETVNLSNGTSIFSGIEEGCI